MAAVCLVIFDLDGTLTRTNDVDGRCFIRAVNGALGIDVADTDWKRYRHTTDSAIARALVRDARGRPALRDELAHVCALQERLLCTAAAREQRAFRPTPGAAGLLALLRADPRFAVALATGAWRSSALVKLAAAGLDVTDVPAAFADDGVARERIVRRARARAERAYGTRFARVVLVGDAPWDARAARRLTLPFLGVAGKGTEACLRAHGATSIVPDFRDLPTVLRALRAAAIPRAPEGVSP